VRCTEAEAFLAGRTLSDDVVRAAADLAYKPAKPLDNADFESSYRKKMAKVYVRRGLEGLESGKSVATP
jgi:CO/xanthine dehydrogenase FAD-binding subunit